MNTDFKLIVIGAGSGGLAHAQRAAEYGVNVAIVENSQFGGTCVNVGCVPKKLMWYAGLYGEHIKLAKEYGFNLDAVSHDWDDLKKRRDEFIRRLNNIYKNNLETKGIKHINGKAKFLGPNTIKVGNRCYRADKFVIATGGYPLYPDIEGSELGITSDEFFELDKCPEKVALIGSGYISLELACIFNALGSEVSVLIRSQTVLNKFDNMLGEQIKNILSNQGISFITDFLPEKVFKNNSGINLTNKHGLKLGGYDIVLWAIGRRANTLDLDLEKAEVRKNSEGFIQVDEWQQTSSKNIFAIGDVTGCPALTPVAIAAGRRLADRLFNNMSDRRLSLDAIPTVIFTHPPIGTVGLTESEARLKFGNKIDIYESKFYSMGQAFMSERERSTMKMIVTGEDQKILGCHLIGDGVDEMLQGFAVAIRMGATKQDFDDTIAIHPTSAEELVTMR